MKFFFLTNSEPALIYVLSIQGSMEVKTKEFWLLLDIEKEQPETVELGLTIALTGHHNAGPSRLTPELGRLAARHPPWVSLSAWTVDYRVYLL